MTHHLGRTSRASRTARDAAAERRWRGGGAALAAAFTTTLASAAPSLPFDAALDTDVLLLAQAGGGAIRIDTGEGDGFAARQLGRERIVKGAPYCADAVHETVQWLADGSGGAPNRIVRQQNTRLCRDGEGRTRQEVERGGRKLVYLRDPVAGEAWSLDPERKTVRKLRSRGTSIGSAGDEHGEWQDYAARMRDWARDFAERMRGDAERTRANVERIRTEGERPRRAEGSAVAATPPTPPTPPAPPTPVVVTREETRLAGRDGELHVLRLNDAGGGGHAEMPALPPMVQWRSMSFAPRGAGVATPLGSREIEGVRADGERTTWTIEAGRLGNEKPIQIVREVWTSPELMLTVSTRDFDPRSGEVSYRLKSIRRGEPDAALMRVPADFSTPGAGRGTPGPKASGPRG